MYPYESFLQESNQILQNLSDDFAYYLLYLDFTDFQMVNHFYGMEAGDSLLRAMEEALKKDPQVRTCVNIFSDQFLCLIRTEKDVDVEKIIISYQQRSRLFLEEQGTNYPLCTLKLSCGICKVTGGNLKYAVDGANLARKEAKRRGSLRAFPYSDAMQKQMTDQYELERAVNDSLREERFLFYLQPKVDLETGRTIGAEALARRVGRDGSIIYPDAFLSVMEANGSIVELDMLIYRKVCAFLADRREKGLPVVQTSVNLSRLHIHNPETADIIHSVAQAYEIPSDLLEFELTETILLDEFSGAKQLIDRLRAYGYRVSIDDFGSGYSGINIWQELNFDVLKLDKKFLSTKKELVYRNEAIVPNMINIAQRLHVQVLCEGVETEEQCLYLKRLGCPTGQGYYFSRPIPPEDFYARYESSGGFYQVPSERNVQQAEPVKKKTVEKKNAKNGEYKFDRRWYLAAGLAAVIFLSISVALAVSYFYNSARSEFTQIMTENLNTYTSGQREEILAEMDRMKNMLDALAVLVGQQEDTYAVEGYLTALSEAREDEWYIYTSEKKLEESIRTGKVREEDARIVERLKEGETVISDITYSDKLGGLYCITIGVPVYQNGKFAGTLRGIINADMLVATSFYPAVQGKVFRCLITDGQGNIIPVKKGDGEWEGSLADRMAEEGIDGDICRDMLKYLENGENASIRVGEREGVPIYFSVVDLGINDWHYVVCFQADMANSHMERIVYRTMCGTVALLVAVAVFCVFLFSLFLKMAKHIGVEERRYLLLEQFSDTVLFDYDIRRDIIRFTPNADRLFRIHGLVQKDFLKNMGNRYIYGGDIEEVSQLFSGRLKKGKKEGRVRLMYPDRDNYFWTLIQYRYDYKKGTVSSVVGKITDIEEQKRHEEYLLEMSETDGLTGLRNKLATEVEIRRRLQEECIGLLFMIDLDNFKLVNDSYGHAGGDEALCFVGSCLQKVFRADDVIGRIGGDEWMVFLNSTNSRELAGKKAELLMQHLKLGMEQGIPPLSVSIGISRCPEDGSQFVDLFNAADRAMYEAKRKGKNCYCFSRPYGTRTDR
ncbi:EAL domain-containing protein [Eisenbergiella massiliensis]|uniref:EAL domain-containing protein n=1 Tax=Eisenbergiella massiliensis TaxID=1720294 RepID=UPI000C862F76|nr:EAL domain-containing protein [Eisenbergiella massiliensis]